MTTNPNEFMEAYLRAYNGAEELRALKALGVPLFTPVRRFASFEEYEEFKAELPPGLRDRIGCGGR